MTHEFAGLTFDGGAIPFIKPRCQNCGMRVSWAAAKQLEGLECQ